MPEQRYDWREIVDRNPRGYAEFNDGKTCTYGPVESVMIDEDNFVLIRLKWAIVIEVGEFGFPKGDWKIADSSKPFGFYNLLIPFVIEDTENGERARWGVGSLIYFDEVKGIDPATIPGLLPKTYNAEGSCPACEGMVTDHKCTLCDRKYCTRCNGIREGGPSPDVLVCHCVPCDHARDEEGE